MTHLADVPCPYCSRSIGLHRDRSGELVLVRLADEENCATCNHTKGDHLGRVQKVWVGCVGSYSGMCECRRFRLEGNRVAVGRVEKSSVSVGLGGAV